MLRSWPLPPARSRKKSSRKDYGISRLLSRKQIDITAAADGLDALLFAVIGAELAPQVAYMHVNAAVHGRHGPAQRGLRQIFPADDLSRITQKRIKQIELRSGEAHRLAIAGYAA